MVPLPKYVAISTSTSKSKFLRPRGSTTKLLKLDPVDVNSWGVKHQVVESKLYPGKIHLRCESTGKYWSWGLNANTNNYIAAQAEHKVVKLSSNACTLIKYTRRTTGGVSVYNLWFRWNSKWHIIRKDGGGFLKSGNTKGGVIFENFIIEDWNQLVRASKNKKINTKGMPTPSSNASTSARKKIGGKNGTSTAAGKKITGKNGTSTAAGKKIIGSGKSTSTSTGKKSLPSGKSTSTSTGKKSLPSGKSTSTGKKSTGGGASTGKKSTVSGAGPSIGSPYTSDDESSDGNQSVTSGSSGSPYISDDESSDGNLSVKSGSSGTGSPYTSDDESSDGNLSNISGSSSGSGSPYTSDDESSDGNLSVKSGSSTTGSPYTSGDEISMGKLSIKSGSSGKSSP